MMTYDSIINSSEYRSGHSTFVLQLRQNTFRLLVKLRTDSVSVDALKDTNALYFWQILGGLYFSINNVHCIISCTLNTVHLELG